MGKSHSMNAGVCKKAFAAMVVAVLALALCPGVALAAEGGLAAGTVTTQADGGVTRAEWVALLVDAFDVTILDDEEDYPDDYFTDVSSDHANYLDIMKATDFGIVDVPAGEAFEPDEPATREFAAETLNFCLGFQLDEDETLVYTEDDTAYPTDMQIALDRGWFGTAKVDAKVAITTSERDTMLADVQDVQVELEELTSQTANIQFADGVKVVSQGTQWTLSDDQATLTITDCPVTLAADDIVAVYDGDMPMAFKVVSVTTDGANTVVAVEEASVDAAFEEYEYSGEEEADLESFQESEDVSTEVYDTLEDAAAAGAETGGITTQMLQTQGVSYKNGVLGYSASVGKYGEISGSISGLKTKTNVSLRKKSAYVSLSGVMTVKATIKASVSKSIPIGYVPVGPAMVEIDAKAKASGAITKTVSANFEVGVQYTKSKKFRLIKKFTKSKPGLSATATASVYVEASLESGIPPVLDASVSATLGFVTNYSYTKYADDDTPEVCQDLEAHLFAETEAQASVDFILYKESISEKIVIWNARNSPVRMHKHIEDGEEVEWCTREGVTSSTWGSKFGDLLPYNPNGKSSGKSGGYNSSGEWEEYATYEYTLDSNKKVTITKYKGNKRALIVPDELDGYEVVAIGSRAFSDNAYLTSVVLPDAVTEIGICAFQNCTALSSVSLPAGLKTLGYYAFCKSGLKKVEIPDGITSIDQGMFQGCASLEEAIVPSTVKTVSSSVFADCTALRKVTLPNSITSIGNNAFSNCDALQTIVLPNSVTSLGSSAFYDCDALTDVTLSTGLSKISSNTFQNCDSLATVILPYRIASIEANAFAECPKLVSITIPSATTTIADSAFSYPTRMTVYGVAGSYAQTWAEEKGATFVENTTAPTSVSIEPSELTTVVGATVTLVGDIQPMNFVGDVDWKSTKTAVATIDAYGNLKAVGTGETTIKLVAGEMSATCKVTVLQPVTSVSLNKRSASLEGGDMLQLTATVSPDTAYDRTVTWSSSNEEVATVTQDGLVTALKKGSATITVAANDGSGKSATCAVTVTNDVVFASSVSELESPHNYSNNCSDAWVYTLAGAESLAVTFDGQTSVEEDLDFIYIYSADGTQVGKWTGTALAGQMVEVPGDTVKIRLVSDSSSTDWGFKVTSVTKAGSESGTTDIATCTVTLSQSSYAYDGNAKTPAVTVKDGSTVLSEGTDYTVAYANNIEVGTATVTVTGMGSYTGTKAVTFRIASGSSEAADQQAADEAVSAVEDLPEVSNLTLADKTAVVSARAKLNALTVEQKAIIGEVTLAEMEQTVAAAEAKIAELESGSGGSDDPINPDAKDISAAVIVLPAQSYTYTGSPIAPVPTVVLGGVLSAGADYVVAYTDNANVGTATAMVVGIGNYTGTATATFSIVKAANPLKLAGATRTMKFKKVKKKAQTVAGAKVSAKGQGTVTYSISKVAKAKFKKKFSINKSTGKITVKKGTKKGTYTVTVKATAAGNANYNSAAKTAVVTIKVK